jgi:hypothetical protein
MHRCPENCTSAQLYMPGLWIETIVRNGSELRGATPLSAKKEGPPTLLSDAL